jgi:alkylated DNA repair dioxygenase AlkB
MNTLFESNPQRPQGFSYFDGFISEQEENELLVHLSKLELNAFQFQGYEAKRKIASFGYDWDFSTRQLSKGKGVPVFFHPLIQKISDHFKLIQDRLAEVLVTEYPEGSVINWHRDAPPFDCIFGLSLFSDCIFRFRPYNKARQGRASIIKFPIKRRSLYMMEGPSRSEWEHSIAPVTRKRYSITLRTLKPDFNRGNLP